MVFRSNRIMGLFAGIITCAMGAFCLLFAWAVALDDKNVMYILMAAGFVLLVLSALCFTYSSKVEIDKKSLKIIKTKSLLFFKQQEVLSMRKFYRVAIGITGGQNISAGPRSSYVILLVERNNNIFRLPGIIEQKEKAINLAKNLSQYIHLPFDPEPRTLFFKKMM